MQYHDYDFNGRRFPVMGPERMTAMKSKTGEKIRQYEVIDPVIVHGFDVVDDKPYYSDVYTGAVADTSRTHFDPLAWGDATLDDNLRGRNKVSTVEEALQTLSTLDIEENPSIAEELIKAVLQAEPSRAKDPAFLALVARQKLGVTIASTEWIGQKEFKEQQGAYIAYFIQRHEGKFKYKTGEDIEVDDIVNLLDGDWDGLALNPRSGVLVVSDNIPADATRSRSLMLELNAQEKADRDNSANALVNDNQNDDPVVKVKIEDGFSEEDTNLGRWGRTELKQSGEQVFMEMVRRRLKLLEKPNVVAVNKTGRRDLKTYREIIDSMNSDQRYLDWSDMTINTRQ